ncbi:MAG: hypothetical protein AAF539_05510 [Planctomycetota bacterium]
MQLRIILMLASGFISTVSVALANDVEVKVIARSVDGATIRLKPNNVGINGYQVQVTNTTTGQIVLPPTVTQATTISLPHPNFPDTVLVPSDMYEVLVQPIPDGVPSKLEIPPFVNPEMTVAFRGLNDAQIQIREEAAIKNEAQLVQNDKLRAQADLMRSTQGWGLTWGEWRTQMLIADDLALDFWNKSVDEFFNRQEVNIKGQMEVLQKREERIDQAARMRRAGRRRFLQRLYHEPRYNGSPETVMNRLLEELRNTLVGYGAGLDEYWAEHPSHDRWELSPEMHESLRIQSSLDVGGQSTFSLADPLMIELDYWPPLLENPTFADVVSELIAARAELDSLQDKFQVLPRPAIERLEYAFAALVQRFAIAYPRPCPGPTQLIADLIKVDSFLTSLQREIKKVRDTKSLKPLSRGAEFDPLVDGNDAPSLLAYMLRYDLKFAAPRPGETENYKALQRMFEELYVVFGERVPNEFEQMPRTDKPAATAIPQPG